MVENLIELLGFNQQEQVRKFSTENEKVNFETRKNPVSNSLSFLTYPYLLVEFKSRATGAGANINLWK